MNDIPQLGSRVVRTAAGDIAVFRTADDEVFALDDRCPHKGGPLTQGIVHDKRVTCPLHNWVIELGERRGGRAGRGMHARASDQGRERHGVAVASRGNVGQLRWSGIPVATDRSTSQSFVPVSYGVAAPGVPWNKSPSEPVSIEF